jgi:hypothetical protein
MLVDGFRRRASCLGLLLVTGASGLVAQGRRVSFGLEAGYGAGLAGGGNSVDHAYTTAVTGQAGAATGTVRFAAVDPVGGDAGFDLAVLLGLGTRGRLRSSAGAGLGLAWDISLGDLSSAGLTLPLEAKMFYGLSPGVAVGLTGFASLNGRRSLGGVTAGIRVGRVW